MYNTIHAQGGGHETQLVGVLWACWPPTPDTRVCNRRAHLCCVRQQPLKLLLLLVLLSVWLAVLCRCVHTRARRQLCDKCDELHHDGATDA